MHTNTYKESQYLPILTCNFTDVVWPWMWRATLTVIESFCLRLEHVAIPALSKFWFNCEKWIIEWDCSSWLQNQEICLGHSTSKMGIRRGTGKTIKCFQDLCILTVKYFLPIYNISSGSLEKAPWFLSSPFLFVAWDLFHNSIKILLGLVHLKTSSGIEFNGLWLLLTKMRKVWEESKFISSRRSLYSLDSWNPL